MLTVALALALLLVSVGLYAGPLPPEPLVPTQENFDLDRFMGKWYDVAAATTCTHMRQSHKGQIAIGLLELQSGATPNAISMTRTALRHGVCKQKAGTYMLTDTPGRFSYHVAEWGADVDTYVVHTNYEEYALMLMATRRGEENSTLVKLYSRTMEARPTLVDDFKRLVKEQGMSEDMIMGMQAKGECVAGDLMLNPTAKKTRRNVLLPAPEEGSGDEVDAPMFKGAESCQSAPDSGPCFGLVHRYFYNSSVMACQKFTYGGCLGNQNNFHTEKECLQNCRTEAACRLPIHNGPCRADVELWAFNSTEGKCVVFTYGGCDGNGNQFYTQKECEEYCGVVKDGDEELLNVN